jgi:hypothetical protein
MTHVDLSCCGRDGGDSLGFGARTPSRVALAGRGQAETDHQYDRDCLGSSERPYVCDAGIPRPVSWRSS